MAPPELCVHQAPIDQAPIVSGNISAIGHDAARRVLAVMFTTGAVYHYVGVPASLHAELMQASSKGAFFARAIRGKFATVKLGGTCSICRQQRAVDTLTGS